MKKFGIEHLKDHLSIDAATVAAIKKGFDAVDFELDELLLKYERGWELDPQLIQDIELPHDIAEQLKRRLPLLETQDRRLRQLRNVSIASIIPISRPVVSLPEEKPSNELDLFTWNEPPKNDAAVPLFELPYYLQEPTRQYLKNGVRSVRIICELLISEHKAPDTGKPHIYLPVCCFMESVPFIQITTKSAEDRHYQLTE